MLLVFSGSRLKEARLRKGWSQSELARAMNTREQNVNRWENDLNVPGANAVAAAACALGVEIDFFYVQVGDDEDEQEAALLRERRARARAVLDSVDPTVADAMYAELQVRHGTRREQTRERFA